MANQPMNPYASPESALAPELSGTGVIAGDTNWTIGSILSDAWRLTDGFKGTFWLMALMMFGVGIVSNVAAAAVAQITGTPWMEMVVTFLLNFFIGWPIGVGFLMVAVRRAAGAEFKATMISEYMNQFPRIGGLMILQSILVILGFICLIVPGIYLALSYLLAAPVLVDRRLGIWESLETSRKAITTCWFRVFALMLVMFLLSLAGLLTLGIGYIWLMPLFALVMGVLYQRLIGYAGGEAT